MSVSLNKVGDVRLAAGDRAGALAAYEESLAIMRKLAPPIWVTRRGMPTSSSVSGE